MKTVAEWIKELELRRHPEGGWYRRSYTSGLQVDGGPALTAIHYLLEEGDFSAIHRLQQDEQWNFYCGSPISIHEINAAGLHHCTVLGPVGPFQHTVPAGKWFGAVVEHGYALVGCTVAPGFDFSGFEMPERKALLEMFPQHEALIRNLTR
jgi:predicted cupin superfamily sugar epimerase